MTYEYVCTACSHEWEASQSINDKPLKTCPACKKRTAKRQISGGTGFVLKGSGWYADLYGSKPPSKESSDDKAADAKAESKSEDQAAAKSSESKSDAKDSKAAKPAKTESSGSESGKSAKPGKSNRPAASA